MVCFCIWLGVETRTYTPMRMGHLRLHRLSGRTGRGEKRLASGRKPRALRPPQQKLVGQGPSAAARRESWSSVGAPATGDTSDPPQGALWCEGYDGARGVGRVTRCWCTGARDQLKVSRLDRTTQNLSFVSRPSMSTALVSSPSYIKYGPLVTNARSLPSSIGLPGATWSVLCTQPRAAPSAISRPA